MPGVSQNGTVVITRRHTRFGHACASASMAAAGGVLVIALSVSMCVARSARASMSAGVRSPESRRVVTGRAERSWGSRHGGPVYDSRRGIAVLARLAQSGEVDTWRERREGVPSRNRATFASTGNEQEKCAKLG